MTTPPLPGGESSSPLKLVKGSKVCEALPTTKTERATTFLEDAYDGAQARIEVLEERLRACHGRLHAIVFTAQFDEEWMTGVLETLASMPEDPTAL